VASVTISSVTLEYEVVGEGEPVLFIHGSFIADAFRPLFTEPSLAGNYRLVSYHRRGYAGSSALEGVLSIEDQASDCQGLLRHLGIARAHVVGHSFGGVIALQLALQAPQMVGTLALLEPALAVGDSGPNYRQSLRNASQRYKEVGAAVAVNEVMTARWPGYRVPLDDLLPGAFDLAVAAAPGIFESELPGLLGWDFEREQASRVTQPALSVLGGDSEALWPRFGETHRTLCEWLPDCEPFVLPGSTHFLQIEQPHEMAIGLANFLERHQGATI
jgi:pimeloyl-ACP methyl ester carboxylesterase